MSTGAMVIIGAGHAGARACQLLRANGWEGEITLLDSEDAQPYERPPLSKAVLCGTKGFEGFPILHEGFIQEQDIRYLRGVSAVEIDRFRRVVSCSNGMTVPYQALLLAPGAEPRRPDICGIGLGKVGVLRSGADAVRLAEWLVSGAHIVIVGGGLIGLEVAVSARLRNCHVTVVETAQRLVQRAVPAPIAQALLREHEAAGVTFRIGRSVCRINGDTAVASVELDDGEVIACDAVLLCIGVTPRTSLAQRCGLLIDNGIAVDACLRTSDPHIYAAGDACSFEDEKRSERIRLECWKNAEDQALIAAKNMLGANEVYNASPWMWSDQYEKTLQVAGYLDSESTCILRRCEDGSILLFHLAEDGTVAAVSGYGSVREVGRGVRTGQVMIAERAAPDINSLSNPSVTLKDLLKPAMA